MSKLLRNKRTYIFAVILLLLVGGSWAFPSDPNNAALLYYQAFNVQPKPDDEMSRKIHSVATGKTEADKDVAEFVEKSRGTIRLVLAATEIKKCNWGWKYSDGMQMLMPNLGQSKEAAKLVIADARILGQNGNYREALKRCLSIERMARHVSDHMIISHLVAVSIKAIGYGCIRDTLGVVGSDSETLEWFRDEMEAINDEPFTAQKSLRFELDTLADQFTKEKAELNLNQLVSESGDESISKTFRERIANADAGFYERNRAYNRKHIAKVLAAMELPYPEAIAQWKKLDDDLHKEAEKNPDATLTALIMPSLWKVYSLDARVNSERNALMVGIELYLIKARTGKLPEELPAGLPKDAYSGKDFEYEKTDEGFVLRCQGKDMMKDEVFEYKFKVKK